MTKILDTSENSQFSIPISITKLKLQTELIDQKLFSKESYL